MTLAAADNYRIAVKTLATLDPVEETSVVVPARTYLELERLLTDTDDPVDILLAPAKNQVVFHLEGIELVSRLIDGQFPNYQQVMPTSIHGPRGGRSRGPAQGGARLGAHRQQLGQRRQGAGRGGLGGRLDDRRRRPTSATRRARSRRPSRASR